MEGILRELLDTAEPIEFEAVKGRLSSDREFCVVKDVHVLQVDLIAYDILLDGSIVQRKICYQFL